LLKRIIQKKLRSRNIPGDVILKGRVGPRSPKRGGDFPDSKGRERTGLFTLSDTGWGKAGRKASVVGRGGEDAKKPHRQ